MGRRVFLAGAAGAAGRRLSPLLVEAGHLVYGTTRKHDVAGWLNSIGVTPVVVDVFDAAALTKALVEARPEIVLHHLTDLSLASDAHHLEEAIRRNAKIRVAGTRNLTSAAQAAGAHRFIAQSIAWVYAPGTQPHGELEPLDLCAEGLRGVTVTGVAALEDSVLSSPDMEGLILRYGRLYGPGTGVEQPASEDSWFQQTRAGRWCGWLAAASANHTFTSGKERFVIGDGMDLPSGAGN
jgi:nucleoside-diphosphate-sugar epimerase